MIFLDIYLRGTHSKNSLAGEVENSLKFWLVTCMQFSVFQGLSQDVHGNLDVNEAKR